MRKFNRKLENSIIENHHETLFFGGRKVGPFFGARFCLPIFEDRVAH